MSGHVTDVGSGTRYSVDGQAVVCVPGVTLTEVPATGAALGKRRELHKDCPVHAFGEPVQVFGAMKKKIGAIEATEVETTLPAAVPVAGYALIDKVLVPTQGELARLRADGYALVVNPETMVTFGPGSSLSLATVGNNVWVRYAGTLGTGGVVAASAVEFSPNVVERREDQLRKDTDFDPASVTEEDRQGGLGRAFAGVKADRLPAYADAAAQSRVERIGAALVPEFQRRLPDTDPTKIRFRFGVVDDEKLRVTLTQPSGVIQMPYQLMARLANDAQLAAILAAEIAEVMEKQALRAIPANERLNALGTAGMAAGIFVPGLGLATGIAGSKAATVMEHHREEQSTRTGLTFMQDAGFDVREAPVAWWRLADRKGKGLGKTEMPYRAGYLYGVLWQEGK